MRWGFTLIELILVVAIITTVGGLSASFYGRFINQNAVSNTVDQIVQLTRKAQTYAMLSRKSNSAGWGICLSSPNLILYQGVSCLSKNSALDEKFQVNTAISISGLTDINFTRVNGIPSTTPTIVVSGLGISKQVVVNSLGMISR